LPSLLFVQYLAIFRAEAVVAAVRPVQPRRDLDNNRPQSVMREFPSGSARCGHLSRRVSRHDADTCWSWRENLRPVCEQDMNHLFVCTGIPFTSLCRQTKQNTPITVYVLLHMTRGIGVRSMSVARAHRFPQAWTTEDGTCLHEKGKAERMQVKHYM